MCRTYMLPWDPMIQTRRPDSGAHGSEDVIYLLLFEATGIIGVTILLLESPVGEQPQGKSFCLCRLWCE